MTTTSTRTPFLQSSALALRSFSVGGLSVERSALSVLSPSAHPPSVHSVRAAPKCSHEGGLSVVPLSLFVCFASFVVSLSAFAQSAPPLINYQGRLVDSYGAPLPTSDYALEVRIYTNAVSGASVWGPQIFDGQTGLSGHGAKVPVVHGYFNVILGPCDTKTNSILDGFAGTETYVSVFTNGTPISPRQRILSTPYALNGVPAGTIQAFGGMVTNVPRGWLLCDGSAVKSSQYSALFKAIGTCWGNGTQNAASQPETDPATDFNLPDLRGQFLRGADLGAGVDTNASTRTANRSGGNTNDNPGTAQGQATKMPANPFTTSNPGDHTHTLGNCVNNWNGSDDGGSGWLEVALGTGTTSAKGNHIHTITSGGDSETRPTNRSVLWIIKY